MSMLEIHAIALESPISVYHEFLLYYGTATNVVYGFIEGKEDPMFYKGLIESLLPNSWNVRLIPGGNRDKVLANYFELDWTRFSARQICFFIDRDLSEFVGDPLPTYDNLYITDKYSIENEIVNVSTFERVLQEVLNITELSPSDVEKIRSLFANNWETFMEAMIPIMAQVILWRRNGEKPCLDDIKVKDFLSFVNGQITLKPQFATASDRVLHVGRCCNLACSIPDRLNEIEEEYRAKDGPKKFIRGKYVLWFFVECALKIHESIHNHCGCYNKPPKTHTTLGLNNALIFAGPRARIPDSLREFVRRTYLQYITEVESVECLAH